MDRKKNGHYPIAERDCSGEKRFYFVHQEKSWLNIGVVGFDVQRSDRYSQRVSTYPIRRFKIFSFRRGTFPLQKFIWNGTYPVLFPINKYSRFVFEHTLKHQLWTFTYRFCYWIPTKLTWSFQRSFQIETFRDFQLREDIGILIIAKLQFSSHTLPETTAI